MRYYFDTSALCRYYHAEPGSAKVEQLIDDSASVNILSWLTVLESQSAFAIKVRNSEISDRQFRILERKLKSDVARRKLLVVRVLRRHFDLAQRLISTYGLKQRLRSLDAIHLGIALDVRAQGRIDALVSADALLLDIALKEGLPVENLLVP